ncbi:ABC transporter substrate-binding protein [Thermodesulfatator atlanticus]|uniref:ABC transporter substrate-binding protein n=1 Tax=Thermodesulfatator atlanticus TaxID=501497 RepID=UPI0003B58337|nr:ABC transporter substrate-binding protein [Thermodesulfatator atlanticus]
MRKLVWLWLGLLVCFSGNAWGEILIGASNAQSGPAKFLGKEYSKGFQTYFQYVNENGGIGGQKIKFLVRDDGYEPDAAITNTKLLINQDKVLFLAGYVGTPTSKAVVPIIEREKIPFFFPFTGAEFLRNPVKRHVFNLRASYYMETEAMVHYLVDKLGLKKIAIFYQDDSFGRAGLAGLKIAMEKRGLSIFGEATYPRNTLAVKKAAYQMSLLKPEAIVLIGAYKPCAAFIKAAKKFGLKNAKFINISFVGSKALARELGKEGDGVLITQVVPFPWDASIPAVAEYQRIMERYHPDFEPGFVSLEGFLAAKTLVAILKKASEEGPLTRESIIRAAESLKGFDPGLNDKITFSPTDHQGFEKVYITEIKNGKFKPVSL